MEPSPTRPRSTERSGSAGRSGSTGRLLARIEQENNREGNEAVPYDNGRNLCYISKRTLVRNDNDQFPVRVAAALEKLKPDDDIDVSIHTKTHNGFEEILKPENSALLDRYLSCEEDTIAAANAKRNASSATSRFQQLDKRVRAVLQKSATLEGFTEYVALVELLLVQFKSGNVSFTVTSPQIESIQVTNSSLLLTLIDSPFHRLILHAVCKYHGFTSVSSQDNGNLMVVSINEAPFASDGTSLIAFLSEN